MKPLAFIPRAVKLEKYNPFIAENIYLLELIGAVVVTPYSYNRVWIQYQVQLHCFYQPFCVSIISLIRGLHLKEAHIYIHRRRYYFAIRYKLTVQKFYHLLVPIYINNLPCMISS